MRVADSFRQIRNKRQNGLDMLWKMIIALLRTEYIRMRIDYAKQQLRSALIVS